MFTLTTGPVAAWPEVLRAASRAIPFDHDPQFLRFYEALARKAQVALDAPLPPVIVQGEAVLALEAAAASLIGPRDVVLALVSGAYGGGFATLARRHAREVVTLAVPADEVIEPGQVQEALRARPDITVVSLCHLDTPSGTVNPADPIGALVAEHGAFLIVDAVSSWGGMPITPVSCSADLFVTGPNKCLGGPPGLSLVAVSQRGWERMRARNLRGSVLALLDWEDAWRADRSFPFTPSIADVHALDAALDLYLAEGPEAVQARHTATARAMRAGAAAMGLSLWPRRAAIAGDTVTVLRVPAPLDTGAWLDAAREGYGVTMAPGRGETEGKVVRIGHMGPSAQPMFAVVALTALAGAARRLGLDLPIGMGVEAALASMP